MFYLPLLLLFVAKVTFFSFLILLASGLSGLGKQNVEVIYLVAISLYVSGCFYLSTFFRFFTKIQNLLKNRTPCFYSAFFAMEQFCAFGAQIAFLYPKSQYLLQ
jgi:hypothetical protein